MKKIVFCILAIFLVTCDNNNKNIEGCLDVNACNYNEDANVIVACVSLQKKILIVQEIVL